MDGVDADLAGRVALVTGGARGIGLATARALASRGASVALADLDLETASVAAREIPHAAAFAVDVSDRNAFAEMLGAVERQLGPVDVLVNNAAVMAVGPLLEIGEPQMRRMVEVNLIGVVHGMQLALPGMLARGRGHLINLASAAGKWGVPGENIHCATKYAVVGLSEIARSELRGSPVKISVVLPGPVSTELAGGMRSNRAIRMISPETVAAAIAAAVINPRFEIWVPRWLGWLETAGHLIPRALREPAQRAFGLERIGTNIDRPRRARYEKRMFGEASQAEHAGKYRALWAWLRTLPGNRVPATFAQIEEIIGMPLPPSCRQHAAHWSSYEGSAVARAIHDAGWAAREVSIPAEHLRRGARLALGCAGLAGWLACGYRSAARSETRPATAR